MQTQDTKICNYFSTYVNYIWIYIYIYLNYSQLSRSKSNWCNLYFYYFEISRGQRINRSFNTKRRICDQYFNRYFWNSLPTSPFFTMCKIHTQIGLWLKRSKNNSYPNIWYGQLIKLLCVWIFLMQFQLEQCEHPLSSFNNKIKSLFS